MNRICLICCFALCLTTIGWSQSDHYSRHQRQGQVAIKMQYKYGTDKNVHQAFGNVYRSDIPDVALDSLSKKSGEIYEDLYRDNQDRFDFAEADRSGILKHFYDNRANMFKLEKENFNVYLDPMLFVAGSRSGSDEQENAVFRNTRGFVLRGSIDEKAYFYSELRETQANFLQYQNDRFDAASSIDGQAFFKAYESQVSSLEGYDFLNATAYFGLRLSDHISIELGHGNHFIGNGYHSLLLNDYSQNYFYLTLDTRVWKFDYRNIFAELSSVASNITGTTTLLPKKYMAAHYLSYKPKKWLELGLFEAVVFSRENNFEFQYLNPIILYRTVEQFLDSPDNVMLGANVNIRLAKDYQLYGQVIVDELKVREVFADTGWWGNKYGLQAGVLGYDIFGIDQLDVRLEGNLVRPFTYSHVFPVEGFTDISTANYSHFSQPLAHPLGSNFRELVMTLSYAVTSDIWLNAKYLYAQKGEDADGINVGGNILTPNRRIPAGTRDGDFGHFLLDGELRTINHFSMDINYQFYHNMRLQAQFIYHDEPSYQGNTYLGLGILVNSFNYPVDY